MKKSIQDLIELFADNLDDYLKTTFNETQTRIQFVDPLFSALGWDLGNESGYSEDYKEVIHSDSLKDEGRSKAPDYAFRVGRERKFFVEAKRPSIDLSKDRAAAYQIRRYAWSAKLPLSILTNFRQFAVYDTRVKPKKTDQPKTGRIMFLDFRDYPSRFIELERLFSKDAILKGAFDRFAAEKTRKGTAPVDEDFLASLEAWRLRLAVSICRYNPTLDTADLSYAVQSLLDRVLFLRICEDKGLERFGDLIPKTKTGLYRELLETFRHAQQRYNSSLFYLHPEGKQDQPVDSLSAGLTIPDKDIRDLIASLYDPAPYVFSVIPPEILGSVYERFLGSQIVLSGRKVSVEWKPDAKKAGGAYYTPQSIVRYMVRGALGRVLAERKPGSKLHVLDMACGSGSFLIEVYQELLDWHEAFYRKQGVTSARFLQKVSDVQGNPEYRLSFAERKRILLDHVFGVDIDPQAVEVTKLSLFLKLINDTSVMPKQLEFAEFKRRLLPDMNRNIVCGNSIVARDVTETVSMSTDELDNFKPMNWHGAEAFEGVVISGGFDVIIGNPPYSYRKSTIEKFKDYYSSNYATTEGNFDIYKMFLERAVKLLKPRGALCQIVNSSFLIQPQFKKLRRFLVRHLRLAEIAVLGPNVFKGVTIDTAIMSARKGRSDARHMISIKEPAHPSVLAAARAHEVPQARFASNEEGVFDWRVTQASGPILDRIFSAFFPMERYCEFSVGINTGSMKAEMTSSRRKNKSYHPCVPGSGLTRYGEIRTDGWIAYDPKLVKAAGNRGRSLPPERFFTSKKILIARTRNTSLKLRIVATVDANRLYNLNRLSNIIARQGTDLYTMMGILNSELVGFIFRTRFFNYEIKPVYLKKLPIPLASHPDISKWVKERLQLSSQLTGAMNPTSIRALEARQRDLESWIDSKVYEVYGLASAAVKTIQREMADLPGA